MVLYSLLDVCLSWLKKGFYISKLPKNVVLSNEMHKLWLLGFLYSGVMESESYCCCWSKWGGGYLMATKFVILTHRSLWSDFLPRLKVRYPTCEIVIPCNPKIPSIDWRFLYAFVVADIIDMCLSMISYQSPSLVVKDNTFLLEYIRLYHPLKSFDTLCFPGVDVFCYIWNKYCSGLFPTS